MSADYKRRSFIMATWKEIRAHVLGKYEKEFDNGDHISIVKDVGEGRTQLVTIRKAEGNKGELWVSVATPVGIVNTSNIDAVLDYIDDNVCGGLTKKGKRHFVRHATLVNDLSPEEFDRPLEVIAELADNLEQKFVGGDEQ
jgi:hypothetical protein